MTEHKIDMTKPMPKFALEMQDMAHEDINKGIKAGEFFEHEGVELLRETYKQIWLNHCQEIHTND